MDYFISHIGVIFLAAVFVAACAVAWWFLTERNAMLIRQRAEARRMARSAQTDPGDKAGNSGKTYKIGKTTGDKTSLDGKASGAGKDED